MSSSTNAGDEVSPYGWYPDPAGSHKLRLWNGNAWTSELESRSSGVQPVFGYSAEGHVTRQFEY